jgi:hypothetical protein
MAAVAGLADDVRGYGRHEAAREDPVDLAGGAVEVDAPEPVKGVWIFVAVESSKGVLPAPWRNRSMAALAPSQFISPVKSCG